jgi:arsenate reductase
MSVIYQYPKCNTCRKALKWLESKDLALDIKDITVDTPSEEELIEIINKSGLETKKFFNTSGRIYKERKLKDVVGLLSVEEAAKMLASEGMLIKRPILVDGDLVLVGFKEDSYESLI